MDWLKESRSKNTKKRYRIGLRRYLEFANTTPDAIIAEYQAAEDKSQWSKDMGNRIVEWYNHLVSKEGKGTNVARTMTIALRAFLASQCDRVRIKRGKIANTKPAFGDHEFTLRELQKMYHFDDVEGKAILAMGIALGWGMGDFTELEWEWIEPFLKSEPFTGWIHERGKTGATTRAHLTPEAIDALKAWRRLNPDAKHVFEKHRHTINEKLKSLAEEAGIVARGRIHFHLLRKFLTDALANNKINEWHVKFIVGKSIPPDILTYLLSIKKTVDVEYQEAYPRFALTEVNCEIAKKSSKKIQT